MKWQQKIFCWFFTPEESRTLLSRVFVQNLYGYFPNFSLPVSASSTTTKTLKTQKPFWASLPASCFLPKMKLLFSRILLPLRPLFPAQKLLAYFFSSNAGVSLYRRISPVGDPNVSVVPILDQYIQEGRHLSKEELQRIVKELRDYKRFKHALEVKFGSFK